MTVSKENSGPQSRDCKGRICCRLQMWSVLFTAFATRHASFGLCLDVQSLSSLAAGLVGMLSQLRFLATARVVALSNMLFLSHISRLRFAAFTPFQTLTFSTRSPSLREWNDLQAFQYVSSYQGGPSFTCHLTFSLPIRVIS
jgi:hypothetical protein